jgi:hypothetical protein
MGPGRIELPTSRLSGVRSNHLSYEPVSIADFGFRIADFNYDHQAVNLNPISTIRSRSDSLTYTLKKEQQKNRCLTARGLYATTPLLQLRQNFQHSVTSVQIHLLFPPTSDFANALPDNSVLAYKSANASISISSILDYRQCVKNIL